MFAIIITEKGGEQRRMVFDKPEVTIGRVQGNDIVLPKGNVSKRHARIVLKDGKFIIVDLKSTNGTYVNGRKITSPLVIKETDKIYIGDFILSVDEGTSVEGGRAPSDVEAPMTPPPPAPPSPSPPRPPLPKTAADEVEVEGAEVEEADEVEAPPAEREPPAVPERPRPPTRPPQRPSGPMAAANAPLPRPKRPSGPIRDRE